MSCCPQTSHIQFSIVLVILWARILVSAKFRCLMSSLGLSHVPRPEGREGFYRAQAEKRVTGPAAGRRRQPGGRAEPPLPSAVRTAEPRAAPPLLPQRPRPRPRPPRTARPRRRAAAGRPTAPRRAAPPPGNAAVRAAGSGPGPSGQGGAGWGGGLAAPGIALGTKPAPRRSLGADPAAELPRARRRAASRGGSRSAGPLGQRRPGPGPGPGPPLAAPSPAPASQRRPAPRPARSRRRVGPSRLGSCCRSRRPPWARCAGGCAASRSCCSSST